MTFPAIIGKVGRENAEPSSHVAAASTAITTIPNIAARIMLVRCLDRRSASLDFLDIWGSPNEGLLLKNKMLTAVF
jgi:hypothetical protein